LKIQIIQKDIKKIIETNPDVSVRYQAQMIVDVAEHRDLKSLYSRLDQVVSEIREIRSFLPTVQSEKSEKKEVGSDETVQKILGKFDELSSKFSVTLILVSE
jgi:predicted PilT family ATPase